MPRVLLIVEDAPAVGALGVPGGRRRVASRRDPQEKKPWKELPGLTHAVERRFIHPLHSGRTLLPFRLLEPQEAIIPWDGTKLLSGADPDLGRYPGLEAWWREAERVWEANRRSDRLSLVDQIDYQRKLGKQFPAPVHRILYSASGQYLAAARLSDPAAVVEHGLYWAPCANEDEARFIAAVFNSRTITERVAPLQARGEHNPRHFDKYAFQRLVSMLAPRRRSIYGAAVRVVGSGSSWPWSREAIERWPVTISFGKTCVVDRACAF